MATILIADDSWLSRQMIEKILKESGHESIQAKDGVEALEKIAQQPPDCLLLDLLMPEMDGFAVLEELKKQDLTLPVIVLSADIQDTSRAQCFELGATSFANKPPKAEELNQLIDEALQA